MEDAAHHKVAAVYNLERYCDRKVDMEMVY